MTPSFTQDRWLEETSRGAFHRREPQLLMMDALIDAHRIGRSQKSALQLDSAIRAYKKAVPDWERSKRNRSHLMASFFNAVTNEVNKYLNQFGCVWSPLHEEQKIINGASSLIRNFHLHPIWQGGHQNLTDLSQFSTTSTIYILAHGHEAMPVFTIADKQFTAKQLVGKMVEDKVRTDHRNFTMMVCHAGESVNTKAAGNALWVIQQKNNELKALLAMLPDNNERKREWIENTQAGLKDNFAAVKAGPTHRPPEMYEPFSDTQSMEEQLLPMAAQLSVEMRKQGFSHFALQSFKAPVINMQINGEICLDLRVARKKLDSRLTFLLPKGHDWDSVPIRLVPDWVVHWR